MPDRVRVDPARRQSLTDIRLHHGAHIVRRHVFVEVLRGEHDLPGFHRHSVLVVHRDLAFRIGPELGFLARFARSGEQLQNFMAVIERCRHQDRRFAAGITEHDALVARAFVLVARRIDALRDVGRLRVQEHFHFRGVPMKTVLLIADVAHRFTGDIFDHGEGDGGGAARLTRNHDTVGGAKRFASDA